MTINNEFENPGRLENYLEQDTKSRRLSIRDEVVSHQQLKSGVVVLQNDGSLESGVE
jgi:hypothetical protein